MALYDTAIPGGAGIAQGYNVAKLAYQNALARIGKSRTDTLRTNGYQAEFDPNTGAYQNLRVDQTNAYGGLQMMLRSQANEDQSAIDNAVGRHIKGGLAHQAGSQFAYQHGAEASNFGQGLIKNLTDLQDQQTGAETDYNNTLWQLQQQAAQQAILDGLFNMGDYGGLGSSGGDTGWSDARGFPISEGMYNSISSLLDNGKVGFNYKAPSYSKPVGVQAAVAKAIARLAPAPQAKTVAKKVVSRRITT